LGVAASGREIDCNPGDDMLSRLSVGEARSLDCDLAIVGAGAAGITLALALSSRRLDVVLVESGDLEYDQDVQARYQGRSVGRDYFDLDMCRLRYFGGSTNHWGGQCAQLDPRDFAKRDWIPGSGWPIGPAALEPHLAEVQRILDLGDGGFDPDDLGAPDPGLPAFDPALLQHRSFRYSSPPTALGGKYRATLEAAPNLKVLLRADLVDIKLAATHGPVQALVVRDQGGGTLEVRARAYVLALGGIENARMLLACDRDAPGGIGNRHDLVGRYFTEHTAIGLGWIEPLKEEFHQAYDEFVHPTIGRHVRHWLVPGDQLMRDRAIGNIAVGFGQRVYVRPRAEGYIALHELKEAFQGREKLEQGMGAQIMEVLRDLDGVAAGLWERFDATIYASAIGEQVPNPDSRVTLGEERDALGLRRVVLDWRLSEIDRRTAAVMIETVAAEFGRRGLGRVQIDEWLLEGGGWDPNLAGNNHHMGTTRMADDPTRGVVDRNCRVYGCSNLFMAGSSVFPTGGAANPTFSIVALTLRLAAHLAEQLEVTARPVDEARAGAQ
jgi:choline dehydrogenase-like flavoprotein